ncbi:3590_t:CDS:2 [Ambispora gerdemannii]|uniref:3590_t:CDS:1 n=1 Tax=Ambispora gerdemannii TaxID=144530 RepID=A0A9N9CTW2_9GLOM|nr:3590_t:CDS:2 [Ambispora gerdemannii]
MPSFRKLIYNYSITLDQPKSPQFTSTIRHLRGLRQNLRKSVPLNHWLFSAHERTRKHQKITVDVVQEQSNDEGPHSNQIQKSINVDEVDIRNKLIAVLDAKDKTYMSVYLMES